MKHSRENRQAIRDGKLHDALSGFLDFELAASFDAIYRSSYVCQSGVLWKSEVQRFCHRRLTNVHGLSNELLQGTYKPKTKKPFLLHERGKERLIAPVAFRDRIVQRSLVDNILEPVMRGMFVTGNAASQAGKGPDWSRDRFSHHLEGAYARFGDEAVLLQYDFKDYFHSVPVERACDMFHKRLTRICLGNLTEDAVKILALLRMFLTLYDGLGIGNQTSQLAAIAYPSPIDHAMEEMTPSLGYGRYMDDGYSFYSCKADARDSLDELRTRTSDLGLTLNESKTRIRKISEPLCYLKRVYQIDRASGKAHVSVAKTSDVMYIRHVKHIAGKIQRGELDRSVLEQGLASKYGIVSRVTDSESYAAELARRLAPACAPIGLDQNAILQLLLQE